MVNKGPDNKVIIFQTAHLFEILSVEFCFPIKVLVTDYMQWLESLIRGHTEARQVTATPAELGQSAIGICGLMFRCVVLLLLPGVGYYITCFPPASSQCLWGYLCLCFGGFCPHSKPALNFLSLARWVFLERYFQVW